eukprot:gnl/TRDRNA2_/TRDRNA2_38580_c0_seq1.p1 gnl/TRDRNA2_/TRDRNA2_38580_c0~~gnl/TRDRNA2_/TRDRNA2_38580_c0_seq1.p1  ORF type:complete len:726 (-),score=212.41 gnl/TRDRNA2_/TRDRNA2_38580_c0_seq1:48-2225(-)
MGRNNVRVIVRTRPTSAFAGENFQFHEASDSVDMRLVKDETKGAVNNQQESWHFKLDKVLVNASQDFVFQCCASEVVRSVMDGYNGTIMAYGQTGAGKTYTMTGGHAGFADRGIVPRAISAIYTEAAARPENNITIRLSYIEIYNELMFDLLTDVGVSEQSGDLQIVEDARGQIQVRALNPVVAGTEEEALHIFFEGDTNRHIAEHTLNKGSSRSHVVFTIHVESRSRVESSEKVMYSKLHLVDLAGSERVKKSGSEGVMLKEATYINKSLTFLEQVVCALGSRNRDHVPYRQSKLTHLLKDSLGGNCKTTMVANVWPEANKLEESGSTLRFATRMMRVSNEATVNVHLDPAMLIRKYERQIKDLKQELSMHDTLAGRSRVQYDEYTPEEQRDLEFKVKSYLDGEAQEIEVQSLRMVYEAFGIFRRIHQQLQTELSSRPTAPAQGGGEEAADGTTPVAMVPEVREGEVGEDEEGKGISVGVAPAGSRPPGDDRGFGDAEGDPSEGKTQRMSAVHIMGDDEQPPDKQVVFQDWKAKEGLVFEEAFERNKEDLKVKRAEMRDALMTANDKKREIDLAKERVDRKKKERESEGPRAGNDDVEELIDEEEYALIKALKELKQQYREAFDQHRQVKMEFMQIEHQMQQCKSKLVSSFEEWYDTKFGGLAMKADGRDPDRFGERMDPQEAFDNMEAERLDTQHPDALAFHKARKTAARDVRQKKATGRRRE